MKRSATSTPSKTKKSKVAVAKRSYKRFYPVPRPLGQYSSGFPKQLAMTHRYSQNVQYTHVGPNANSQYANFGTNCLLTHGWLMGAPAPLLWSSCSHLPTLYRNEGTNEGNHRPQYRGRLRLRYSHWRWLNPSHYNFRWNGWTAIGCFKTSQRDAEVVTIYKNWDVKSAFTTNPLANPNLQGDAAANPVETQAFIIFNRPVDQTVVSMQFNLYVSIEYDAVWTELRTMTMS